MASIRRFVAPATFLALTVSALHAQSAPTNGREVLERMQKAYAGKWYRTLTFVQKTTLIKDGTSEDETWYESVTSSPTTGARLRIDAGDLAKGNGVVYTADSMYVVRDGTLKGARATGNPFLPLIQGVYIQPVDRTVRELKQTGVNLDAVSSGTWQGRPAWVVGTKSGDGSVPQFWVDQERWVLLRMKLALVPNQPLMDIDLGGYQKAGQGWLATKVTMSVDGKPTQTEEYSDWKVDVTLDPALFEVATWSTAPHWARKR